jgi:hypothetical protein
VTATTGSWQRWKLIVGVSKGRWVGAWEDDDVTREGEGNAEMMHLACRIFVGFTVLVDSFEFECTCARKHSLKPDSELDFKLERT